MTIGYKVYDPGQKLCDQNHKIHDPCLKKKINSEVLTIIPVELA